MHFVATPDEGDRSFIDKFRDQIKPAGTDVIRLAAELLAVYFLFPSNVGGFRKRQVVNEVLDWVGPTTLPENHLVSVAFEHGIGSGGQGATTRADPLRSPSRSSSPRHGGLCPPSSNKRPRAIRVLSAVHRTHPGCRIETASPHAAPSVVPLFLRAHRQRQPQSVASLNSSPDSCRMKMRTKTVSFWPFARDSKPLRRGRRWIPLVASRSRLR